MEIKSEIGWKYSYSDDVFSIEHKKIGKNKFNIELSYGIDVITPDSSHDDFLKDVCMILRKR